jgi:DtxR family Mn-dependent transcriptional regulator
MTVAGTGTDLYCGTIYELAEDDVAAAQVHLAARLGVSRAAVSEMVKRLRDDGLVTLEGGRLRLTGEGLDVAERAVRRHRLAERFLVDVLELGWAEAHHEAGRWQHVLTDDTESALQRMLGDPATCPHGNPVPGVPQVQTDAVRLAELPVGAVARIVRIAERLEVEAGMLEAFEHAGVIPGVQIVVAGIDHEGTITVRGPRRQLQLTAAAALDVFVVEGDLAAISDAVAGRTLGARAEGR